MTIPKGIANIAALSAQRRATTRLSPLPRSWVCCRQSRVLPLPTTVSVIAGLGDSENRKVRWLTTLNPRDTIVADKGNRKEGRKGMAMIEGDYDGELWEQTARGVLAVELERANELYAQAEADYRNANGDPWGDLTIVLERAAQRHATLSRLINIIDDIHDQHLKEGGHDNVELDTNELIERNYD